MAFPSQLPIIPSNGSGTTARAVGRPARAATASRLQQPRLYRLVDQEGGPHPVLDDLYDTLDAAWGEAIEWWCEQFGPQNGPVNIGVEVSTGSGSWRTLRHPGS